MGRTDLEAAAAEKYPDIAPDPEGTPMEDARFPAGFSHANERAAYIEGRLDQAEADAGIAARMVYEGGTRIAAAIRKGVE